MLFKNVKTKKFSMTVKVLRGREEERGEKHVCVHFIMHGKLTFNNECIIESMNF